MESVLMTTPPVLCASSSASADLPLAVGPAISTAVLIPREFACMSLVATPICDPAAPALDTPRVGGALAVLPPPGGPRCLLVEVALDILRHVEVQCPDAFKAIET